MDNETDLSYEKIGRGPYHIDDLNNLNTKSHIDGGEWVGWSSGLGVIVQKACYKFLLYA